MSIAVISLLGLVAVVVVSCVNQKINPGLLAVFTALAIGTTLSDVPIKSIIAAFPSELFLLLVSMCLVFGVANQNGTLQLLTNKLVGLINGKATLLPILFFFLSFALSAMGPGNIAAVALIAPLAMILAHQYKISSLLIAIMICTGANAGAFSPFAPTGVVSVKLMDQIGLETVKLPWMIFLATAVLQSLTAVLAYGIFLLRRNKRISTADVKTQSTSLKHSTGEVTKLNTKQWITCFGILALISGVILFKVPLLIMSLFILLFFTFLNVGDIDESIAAVPWSTVLMVTGMSVLIGLMEKTGGLDLATTLIAQSTAPQYIHSVLAFVTGVVSAFSSSSGVVMPAFIPLIPGLAEKMQLQDTVNLVISVAVGSHMVDVSPLSTLGALSLAAVVDQSQRQRIFKMLMFWGMSMAFVGAALAYVFLDLPA
jgi:di/tricarboxylate transporter